MKRLFIPILILSIMFLSSCGKLNDNPPEYVKEVVAYKEGSEGLIIYLILADGSGAMTTSDGKVTLAVYETPFICFGEAPKLYSTSLNIEKTDFYKTEVGTGSFKHKVIVYSFGRIAYSSFRKKPYEAYGKVKLKFHCTDGRVLKGEDAIYF